MKKTACVAISLLALSAAAVKMSDAVPKGWVEDFEAAKKAAAAEGKLVFLAFSGSDWCGWCVKLDQEVYSQSDFIRKAKRMKPSPSTPRGRPSNSCRRATR